MAQQIAIIISALFIAFYGGVASVTALWLTYRRRMRRRTFAADYRPGVTILKPLAGVDEDLEANLISFFELDYEPLQIVFGSDRDDDPGIEVARRVTQQYPRRDVHFVTGCTSPAVSPKVVNLEAMLPHARHELVLLSDSNVRIDPGDLALLVQPMRDQRVGLVYTPVVGVGEESAPAAVENLRLSEYPGMLMIAAKTVAAQDCAMGKGILCRRAALSDIGDFTQVRDAAADDYLLAILVKRAGWKVYLSEVPAQAVHVRWSWNSFLKRHARHAALRCRLSWLGILLELILAPSWYWLIPPLLMGLPGLILSAAVIVLKGLIEIGIRHYLYPRPVAWRFWFLSPVKDVLMFWLVLCSPFEYRVYWRGKWYRMTRSASLVPIDGPAVDQARPVSLAPQDAAAEPVSK